ncbi:MAG: hypothetical protein GF317_04890 [Candidatus Lokiarchaeota archaeon]|nr:hypothetical protein [Candidatus Lokiarchaeota archaeon]
MNKIILLIGVLFSFILFEFANAGVVTTTVNVNLSTSGADADDSLIIASGDTVVVDTHAGASDTTVSVVFVREGGVLLFDSTSSCRANFGALWAGGTSSPPWSSSNGGKIIMDDYDTLGIFNDDLLGNQDVYFNGSTAEFICAGSDYATRIVILGIPSGTTTYSDYPYIQIDNASKIDLYYTRFAYLYGQNTAILGLQLGEYGQTRDGNSVTTEIDYCYFDYCGLFLYNTSNLEIRGCAFYNYNGVPFYSVNSDEAPDGSGYNNNNKFVDCDFYYDNNNQDPGSGTLMGYEGDSLIVDSCNFITQNYYANISGMTSYGIVFKKSNYCIITRSYLEGFQWGITSTTNSDDIIIEDNIIYQCGHENVFMQSSVGDSAWTIKGNLLKGSVTSKSHLLIYTNASNTHPDVDVLYNTIHLENGIHSAFQVAYPSLPGSDYIVTGVNVIGNIFIGGESGTYDIDIDDSITVNFDDFKYNALDIINGNYNISGYSLSDSNEITEEYGFYDSLNNYYLTSLDGGSPMLNAGDSIWWVYTFEPDDSSTAPGNIGWYQGIVGYPGIDTEAPDNFSVFEILSVVIPGAPDDDTIRLELGDIEAEDYDSLVLRYSESTLPEARDEGSALIDTSAIENTTLLIPITALTTPTWLYVASFVADTVTNPAPNWGDGGLDSVYVTESGSSDDTSPDDFSTLVIYDIFTLGSPSIGVSFGSVDSTDYDSMIVRYGASIPLDRNDGSLLFTGGNLENYFDTLSLSATTGYIYIKAFTGDEVPNWSDGKVDSVYFPTGCGSGNDTKNLFRTILGIQDRWEN